MRRIKVSNNTLTNLGGGVVSLLTGSDGGGSAHDILSLLHSDTDETDTPVTSDVLTYTSDGMWKALPGSAHGSHTGGGGGGTEWGDGKPYVWTPPSSPNSKDDEFGDASGQSGPSNGLDAKWSKHNLGTAGWTVLNSAIAPGCVLLDVPTGQAADQHLYQSAPSDTDYTIHARFSQHRPSDRQMWFINILDTNGDGVGVGIDSGDVQILARTIDNWQQTGTATQVAQAGTYPYELAHGWPIDVWLRKENGTFRAAGSWNDRLLEPTFVTTHAITSFTPAYITFGRIFGGGSVKAILDYFRVTSP